MVSTCVSLLQHPVVGSGAVAEGAQGHGCFHRGFELYERIGTGAIGNPPMGIDEHSLPAWGGRVRGFNKQADRSRETAHSNRTKISIVREAGCQDRKSD